jgi:hypothetical protein
MAKLQVELGADISELKDKLAEAQVLLEKLQKQKVEKIKVGLDTLNLQKQINDAKTNISSLTKAINANSAAQVTNSKATANGSSTLTQFSRIAQDAPFGIMGIGNNLTATAESFGYLSQSAGGAGNALKAVGASLLGPGGLILAISVVTSGLTYMAQQGLSVGDVFSKLTGTYDEYGSVLKKATEEGTKSAIQETSALKGLVAIAQSEAESKRIRLEAVDKLQKMYPNYFGNLSKEEIMYGNITGVVDDLSRALINKAIAEKLSEAAVEPTLKLWQANQRYKDAVVDLRKAEQDLVNFRNKPNVSASQVAMFNAKIVGAANDKVKEAIADIQNYSNQVDKINQKIEMTSKAGAKAIVKPGASEKPQPKPKKYKNPNPNFDPGTPFIGGGIVNPNSGIVTPDLGVDKQAIEAAQKLKDGLAFQTELIKEFDANANTLIENSIANTFSNLGNAIGEALATGGNVLKAAGNSILQSMGKFLSDMGDMLIKYGTLAVLKGKLDLAILTGGPVSIAAGVAAIGVGIALKAISGAIGAKANAGATAASSGGGSQRGAMSSGADVQSPTSSVNSGGGFSNNGGTVVFEISGQKLIGVLSNTLGANQRLGGNLAIGN